MAIENQKIAAGKQVLTQWQQAIAAASSKAVVELYDDQATLVPTLDNEVKRGKELITVYFDNLLLKEAINVEFKHFDRLEYSILNEQQVLFAGLYDFKYKNAEGQWEILTCRFSFLIAINSGQIIHHHSSRCPNH